MKRFVILLFAWLAVIASIGAQQAPAVQSPYSDAAPQTKEIIDAARLLEAKGQYSKAWNLLAAFDPDSKDGYVLAEKIRIALEDSIGNGMLVSFSFVDLAEGQSIYEAFLNPPEKQTIVDFNPLDLVEALEKSSEAIPPILSLELAGYLYAVNQQYSDNWMIDGYTIQQKAVENYDRALAYGLYNDKSLANHAELLMNLQQYEGAEKVLRQAISLFPEELSFAVSLANSLNYQGKFDQVYSVIDKVIEDPDVTSSTYNAYVEGIKAGLNSGDTQKTDLYVDAMIERFPDEYAPMLIQHLVAVIMGEIEEANVSADSVTEKFNVDPNVVQSLLSTWLGASDPVSGFDYLNRSLEKYTSDDQAMGTLFFYRALMYAQTARSADDLKLAIVDMEETEKRFSAVYDKEDPVFQTIEQLLTEWKQIIEQLQESDSASSSEQSTPPEDSNTASGTSN
ncbi:MAG TPA: hypothetical protein PLE76_04900 [Rectinema sp.]|jgi:tetratricopeptide (TPR) repeat protein|nr:hypothetical protein [Spirochaetia bacterium]NLH89707.1 hypothetical protein [Treponema sp.]OQC74669.1 MAG: hypothetical protein BWX44_00692 [Spirochaetes bacterium ADurb.Bin001]HNP93670.1 hypothetical protein [Rectinema sp.]HNT59816.1 hypothetical protein [Rectinema sp.]